MQHLFEKFIEAARYFRRLPTSAELRMYRRTRRDWPNEKTVLQRFGSKAGLLSKLRGFIADKPEYADVAAMLGPEPEREAIDGGLPEATVLIHAIHTDDPAGIEAYWHARFAERRTKGEWFKLTREDVAAFKRRKRQ